MSSRTKLTPELCAQIARRRAQGASYAAIAKEFGVSEGSVRNALVAANSATTRARGSRSASATAVASAVRDGSAAEITPSPRNFRCDSADMGAADMAADEAEEITLAAAPTQEELRSWLAEQARGLRADAARLRREGNMPGLEVANRQLAATMQILARVTPEPESADERDFVRVPKEGMREMAEEVSARLHKMIDLVAGSPREATCEECSRRAHALPGPLPPPPVSNRRIA